MNLLQQKRFFCPRRNSKQVEQSYGTRKMNVKLEKLELTVDQVTIAILFNTLFKSIAYMVC